MRHASIYYHPEGYVTSGQRIMGRQCPVQCPNNRMRTPKSGIF